MSEASRKAHKKSRTGCAQCKRRKVKCGEDGHPCRNCVRRGTECHYLLSQPHSATPDGDVCRTCPPPRGLSTCSETTPSRQSDFESPEQLPSGLHRWEELCLIHQYATTTHKDVTRTDSEAETWRNTPFQDGTRYPFVLDAVLALTALHRAYQNPQDIDRYIRASLHYQSSGLRAYTRQLDYVNPSNCHAVFGFAAIINLAVIAISRGGSEVAPTSPVQTLLTVFELSKGIKAVIDSSYETLLSGPYQAVFTTTSASSTACASEEVTQAIEAMSRWIADFPKAALGRRADVYMASINTLHEAFRQVESSGDFGVIIAWIMGIHDEAVKLLETRDPMMCLIFMHYGVLYLHVHNTWWARGFGARMIWDLSSLLHGIDTTWAPLTRWARARADSVYDREAK